MTKYLSILCISFIFFGCKSKNGRMIDTVEIELATIHSGEPNLTVSQDGSTYLSWVEYANDSLDILMFSKLEEEWTTPKMIAQGSDWFVNWADFPSLVKVDDAHMTAHWLQKSARGTYDYDVHIAQSRDNGNSWSSSIIPHKDGVNAEHGFVSMVPTPDHKTFLVWLDGRNTKNEENNAMTLRSAEIDEDGNLSEEIELDRRVCDCCQTGTTWTDKGPIVVYRDRSEDEIRDISMVRKVDGQWTSPQVFSNDEWKIAGCPVNGPSIDSDGSNVAVAWFTMAEDNPRVFAATSMDSGQTFSDPVRLDQGKALGRVDVVIDGNEAIVTWMEDEGENAAIKMRFLNVDGRISEVIKIGVNSNSRSSGFPRIVSNDSGFIMAWTDALEADSKVRTFKVGIIQ